MLGVLSSLLISFYFSMLVLFSFVSHPLVYCLLLVSGGLSLSLATLFWWGFSWYLVIFVLVYVGGVYVLFLFVSVHGANSYPVVGFSPHLSLLFLLSFYFFFSFFTGSSFFFGESSYYLCSGSEGLSYLVLCFSLLIGFMGVSVVSGQKDSFFR